VSRVHETGLVNVDPDELEVVLLPEPAVLVQLGDARPGAQVRRGHALAQFKNQTLEHSIVSAREALNKAESDAHSTQKAANKSRTDGDPTAEARYLAEHDRAVVTAAGKRAELAQLQKRQTALRELRAPRDGTIITAPKRDELNKAFDVGYTDTTPVFAVGDPSKLIIRVPVSPPDFRVLRDDLNARGELEVSVYAKGRSDRQFTGKLRALPQQNAASVPLALSQRGGGALAVRQGDDPNVLIPLAQVYVVEVELNDADAALEPGQLAVVKIHTRWRSGAWWVGRALANAMDLGLY
jgi:putative peptide zinc metalloprotease protein